MVRQYRYITFQDRKQISTRYLNGDRVADIADGLGVTAATVYRELKRGETGGLDRNQRRAYKAVQWVPRADDHSDGQLRRSRDPYLHVQQERNGN